MWAKSVHFSEILNAIAFIAVRVMGKMYGRVYMSLGCATPCMAMGAAGCGLLRNVESCALGGQLKERSFEVTHTPNVPSHVGAPGNKFADSLTTRAHTHNASCDHMIFVGLTQDPGFICVPGNAVA